MTERWEYRTVATWPELDQDVVSIAFSRLAEGSVAVADREQVEAGALRDEMLAKHVDPAVEQLQEIKELRELRVKGTEMANQLRDVERALELNSLDERRATLTLSAAELPARLNELRDARERDEEWAATLRRALASIESTVRGLRVRADQAVASIQRGALDAMRAEVETRSAAVVDKLQRELSDALDELLAVERLRAILDQPEIQETDLARYLTAPAPVPPPAVAESGDLPPSDLDKVLKLLGADGVATAPVELPPASEQPDALCTTSAPIEEPPVAPADPVPAEAAAPETPKRPTGKRRHTAESVEA
jgi:hypothetical protein